MKTAIEILNELEINVQHTGEGSQSAVCPKCSHTRKKKTAKCLKVHIDHEGIRFFCHHCQDHGGVFFDSDREYITKKERKTLSMADMRGLRNA